ncbi:MAG TPA: antibiotic biosynthesis monooxygenase [Candidatus Methylomirabilis sp.]|nr:antibiotic biosynthesis monooxygenase [Candidatus Methylomirabilis sp.]
MGSILRVVLLILGVTMATSVGIVGAQGPVAGPIYSVIYVEVMPTATATAAARLRSYREATRKEDGNLRGEIIQRISHPNQFVVLAAWRDQKAFEAHAVGTSSTEMRAQITAIRNAPTDERVHVGLALGPPDRRAPNDAVYVVTHVDVIPPRKDDGMVALRQLAEDSRKGEGNLRFEVVQQINRPNHFTVVEIWESAKAVEAHSMAAPTRRFRDALAPATGALYDERMYRALD